MTQAPEWTDEQLAQAQKAKQKRMGACLTDLRLQLNMEQEEAAKALGMTARGLNQIEMGWKKIGGENFQKAVRFYQSKGAVINEEPEEDEGRKPLIYKSADDLKAALDIDPDSDIACVARDFNDEFQAALDAANGETEKPQLMYIPKGGPPQIIHDPESFQDGYQKGWDAGVKWAWEMAKELDK